VEIVLVHLAELRMKENNVLNCYKLGDTRYRQSKFIVREMGLFVLREGAGWDRASYENISCHECKAIPLAMVAMASDKGNMLAILVIDWGSVLPRHEAKAEQGFRPQRKGLVRGVNRMPPLSRRTIPFPLR